MSKPIIDLLAMFVGVILAFIIQDALPPMADFHGAHVLLVPLVFCYAAMVMPFPSMLAAALYTGYLSDLMYLHVVDGKAEIPLGFSIIYFVIYGCFANGFQPSMKSLNVLPFVLLSGVGTSLFLLLQFIAITVHRGGFVWGDPVTWRILAPGIMAALIAPLFYWTLSHIDRLIPATSRKLRPIKRRNTPGHAPAFSLSQGSSSWAWGLSCFGSGRCKSFMEKITLRASITIPK